MAAAVCVDSLTKRYGNFEAVHEVSFDVQPGEIFALLGPNGAGKTTTLECILGLRTPDSGVIRINDIDALAHPSRIKHIIGAQLQATALQDHITPLEALKLFASFYKKTMPVPQLIDRFQLSDIIDAPFSNLSTGQKQRLAIALAFINDPSIIFLDEPTAGLDAHARRDVYAAIESMRTDGRTVILTTHYIEEAEQLCQRVAIINDGRIVKIDSPRNLVASSSTPPRIVFRSARPLDPESLTALPGSLGIETSNNRSTILTRTLGATTIALVKLLEEQANDLLDLEIRHPTLEDVFIELTGSPIEPHTAESAAMTALGNTIEVHP